jgi:hypothetical protein
MGQILFAMNIQRTLGILVLGIAVVGVGPGCSQEQPHPGKISPGVVIQPDISRQAEAVKIIHSIPPGVMRQGGLAGAQGGVHLKFLLAGTYEVLIPVPLLADSQVPVCNFISTTPREAGMEYRLRQREDTNAVVGVQLKGKRDQEIKIEWSSIILIANQTISSNLSRPESYLQETACVQSGAEQIKKLAAELWPSSGKVEAYAAKIQDFIRKMKQAKPPRSLDAAGILDSGANMICTANANLAAALLRGKGVPCRSIAVIPTTGQRLEMHRIVEYFAGGKWMPFDPSSLNKNIPLTPWQNIIMARTTINDEQIAMKPRMGVSVGCPYGQELELFDGGITPWGQDFFWTIGKPLAEFEASDESIELTKKEWNKFLASGTLSLGQIKAASANNAEGFLKALRTK